MLTAMVFISSSGKRAFNKFSFQLQVRSSVNKDESKKKVKSKDDGKDELAWSLMEDDLNKNERYMVLEIIFWSLKFTNVTRIHKNFVQLFISIQAIQGDYSAQMQTNLFILIQNIPIILLLTINLTNICNEISKIQFMEQEIVSKEQTFFRKVWTRYIQNFDQKSQLLMSLINIRNIEIYWVAFALLLFIHE